MYDLIKSTAAIVALSALFFASASTAITQNELESEINDTLSTGSVIDVDLKGNVVTLTGTFVNKADESTALAIIEGMVDVEEVKNLAFTVTF